MDSVSRTPVLRHVAQNVRHLRQNAGLSQAALSDRAGVSRRMLVAIEAGESNVSLTTLDRLAEALEVAFSDLLQNPVRRDPSRINEVAWAGKIPGSRGTLLASVGASRAVELWEWRLEPGDLYMSDSDPFGWSEQVYVIEGLLTLILAGQERRLRSGEFFVFASHEPHGYRNDGELVTRFVRNVVM